MWSWAGVAVTIDHLHYLTLLSFFFLVDNDMFDLNESPITSKKKAVVGCSFGKKRSTVRRLRVEVDQKTCPRNHVVGFR